MRSPAVPPASRALRAALYSVGGVGLNSTLMSGYLALKAGMMVPVQISASSLRQLSMVRVWAALAAWTLAVWAATTSADVASRLRNKRPKVGLELLVMALLPVWGHEIPDHRVLRRASRGRYADCRRPCPAGGPLRRAWRPSGAVLRPSRCRPSPPGSPPLLPAGPP